jgi:hypothetical protein
LCVNKREIGMRDVVSILVVIVVQVIAADNDRRVEQNIFQE